MNILAIIGRPPWKVPVSESERIASDHLPLFVKLNLPDNSGVRFRLGSKEGSISQ